MSVVDHLKAQGIRADKKLGQHFLVNADSVGSVLDAANLKGDETVVEVGPGPALLTPGLAERASRVVAIELDRNVIPVLKANTAGLDNVEIQQADILKVDPAGLPQPYVVVANLPYYITSAVLKHFLENKARPATMTVTVQAEVAERIVAKPPKMSILAISIQLYGRPRIAAKIPRTAFWPAPEVDSAVLRIEQIGVDLEQTLSGLSETDFFKVVRAGFGEKRKQLHNSLSHRLGLTPEQSMALLEGVKIDPSRRAETLTIPEWVQLGHAYAKSQA